MMPDAGQQHCAAADCSILLDYMRSFIHIVHVISLSDFRVSGVSPSLVGKKKTPLDQSAQI